MFSLYRSLAHPFGVDYRVFIFGKTFQFKDYLKDSFRLKWDASSKGWRGYINGIPARDELVMYCEKNKLSYEIDGLTKKTFLGTAKKSFFKYSTDGSVMGEVKNHSDFLDDQSWFNKHGPKSSKRRGRKNS